VGSSSVIVRSSLLSGWAGIDWLGLYSHFGLFHLLSLFWRALGFNVRPIMRSPGTATVAQQVLGRSWNAAFSYLMHEHVFKPVDKSIGARRALFTIFLNLRLLHLGLLCAGLMMPGVVQLRAHLNAVPCLSGGCFGLLHVHWFVPSEFWVHHSYAGRDARRGRPLARALCGFFAAFWTLRLIVATFILRSEPIPHQYLQTAWVPRHQCRFHLPAVVYCWRHGKEPE